MENERTMCINISENDKKYFERMVESQGISPGDLFKKYQENYLLNMEDEDYDNTGLNLGYNKAKHFYQACRESDPDNTGINVGYNQER
ncbi:hypothetical protein [Desulforamulus aquiferis]|uniref:Uncharacterized protein n=1 Tax=Desulforamulus aquiferis TaxID=1397668 RepID=A0AAW7ZGA7_9FIRM|nr:hypothetical protein [Desulforamulus aquiferis]MDO7787845.1 hypothetical protein [Desulforamulus aquiferis]